MPTPNDSFKYFVGWLLAVFLTVLGAHCWVVWLYGSALPFWDQWDEAISLFKPWMEGHLTWADVAEPDSDHRIILTHIWDMCLIWLNGRWDPLMQMTLNAFFHAVYACGLAFCLWHFRGRKDAWLVCGLLLPFFTLPYAGENAVWGLNSLWYFLPVFGLAAILGLGFFRAGSWPWWSGLAAALLGLMAMALGPIAPMAVGGLILLRAIKHRRLSQEALITLAVCLAVVGVGLAMSVRKGYYPLQAHSVAEFASALVRCLDWPFYQWRAMACVIPLPLVILLIYYLRPNFQALREAEFLLTLGLWSVLQSIVLAFGRANYGDIIPASRYTEVFSLLLIASIFATVLLCEQWRREGLLNLNVLLLPLVFAGVIYWGVSRMSDLVVDNLLVTTRVMNLIAEERITKFRATGNENDLLERPTVRPDPKVALAVLRDPKLQPILPVACVSPSSTTGDGWLAAASRRLLQHSIVIMGGGLVLFAGLCGFDLARGARIGLPRGAMTLTARIKPEEILALLAALAALGFVWSKHSLQRDSLECGLQQQLADYFKSSSPDRATFHLRKAEELKRSLGL